jgi:hypothetical protein
MAKFQALKLYGTFQNDKQDWTRFERVPGIRDVTYKNTYAFVHSHI